jgi:hypothetical protein
LQDIVRREVATYLGANHIPADVHLEAVFTVLWRFAVSVRTGFTVRERLRGSADKPTKIEVKEKHNKG